MAQAPHQEEILGKAYDFRLIKRLWQFIRPYKRLFYVSLLLLPLQQALGLAQPYLMKVGIDQYIAGKDLWGLQTVMMLFLGALIGETLQGARAFGFTRIELSYRQGNARVAALYESFGFVREGVQRSAVRVDGVYEDLVLMALIFG